jgi:hypothetical protein
MSGPSDEQIYERQIQSHRQFLSGFEGQRLKRWEELLSHAPEAAIVDACTRMLLDEHTQRVEPFEHLSDGGPDYICYQGNKHFYVEATCLQRATVTENTGLDPSPRGAQDFGLLTNWIFQKANAKAKQCSGLDGACLLAIGTLHSQASAICFDRFHAEECLTGIPKIEADIDTRTGGMVGEPRNVTNLEKAVPIRPDQSGQRLFEEARKSLSGLLLCGFGCRPSVITGLLHPNPARPFDVDLLPNIAFGSLRESGGRLHVDW